MIESHELEILETGRVDFADTDFSGRRRGSTKQMLKILSQAPRVEPEPNDRLPTTTNG